MQICKARHPLIYVVHGKKKNEDSRGPRRLYRGSNCIPKFQDILHECKHLKRRRKQAFQPIIYTKAPRRTEGGVYLVITSKAP